MSIRNIEDLELDDITEDTLRDERDDLADDYGVDSREGSLYYDATEAHILRAAKFFNDLRSIDGIISLDTCTGDVLDEWLRLKGMTRNPIADTPATYAVTFSGSAPEVGEEMSCDDHMFTLIQDENDNYFIVSEETGTMSLAQGGVLRRGLREKDLREILTEIYAPEVSWTAALKNLLKRRGKEARA